ncbi:MAG: pilus assembly protein [Hyphomonadaceae bacterium]|nr:pilus assembly protein [Hyphomonadaceae bacterium]MCA8886669.1 pilus assembly protein [Hyphomonadaceae bacterium]
MFARALRRMKAWRRFSVARRGSVAVEFALVLMPFFLLTFGLAEVSMIGFAQTSLDFAVSETARQIRTGQAQMNGVTEAQIKTQLCSELNNFIVMGCDGNLFLDVRRFSSFVDASNNAQTPIQNNEFNTAGMGYQPGQPSDIVVVRAYYRWKVMTPLFEPVFQNISGGERILVSTMMFRNEPYASS